MFSRNHISSLLMRNRDPLPVSDPWEEDTDKRAIRPGDPILLELKNFQLPDSYVIITYPSGYSEGTKRPHGHFNPDHKHIPDFRLKEFLQEVFPEKLEEDFLEYIETYLCDFRRCAVFLHEKIIRNVQTPSLGSRSSNREPGVMPLA